MRSADGSLRPIEAVNQLIDSTTPVESLVPRRLDAAAALGVPLP